MSKRSAVIGLALPRMSFAWSSSESLSHVSLDDDGAFSNSLLAAASSLAFLCRDLWRLLSFLRLLSGAFRFR